MPAGVDQICRWNDDKSLSDFAEVGCTDVTIPFLKCWQRRVVDVNTFSAADVIKVRLAYRNYCTLFLWCYTYFAKNWFKSWQILWYTPLTVYSYRVFKVGLSMPKIEKYNSYVLFTIFKKCTMIVPSQIQQYWYRLWKLKVNI